MRAGDLAEFRPIGFSADGTIFAFEQFGIEDGSGFAYAERYYIDTREDRFVSGTPVRVRLRQDGASVQEARDAAAEQAAGIEETYLRDLEPGILAEFAPANERGSSPHRLRYDSWGVSAFSPDAYANTVRLSELVLDGPALCTGVVDTVKGFRLVMTERDGRPVNDTLHADARVPTSRKCPLAYALAGAMTHANRDGTRTHAVIVLMRTHGFEGPDGRYLVVTARLD
ncbi:DUF2259 domain-containing protein [Pseudohoeflea coraliihabitans]|uniref:DUF2259 domain-containing protein n=1 Tax=Pseudohoeflea coraliihabitans TaxID=2860393 RepID=A0ABS6WSE5_9HYPH|nr:DUF2259 domain-containing protein [Pseudohoeflea sp. DP4N28-3]